MSIAAKKPHSRLFVIAINLLVFVGLLVTAELVYRAVATSKRIASNNEDNPLRFFWTMYRPFVMFTATSLQNRLFVNVYKQGKESKFVGKFILNSDGFVMNHELDFSKAYPKAANERFILFTGGSAAWGVGATSDHNTVPARMEYYLNRYQSKYNYRVFNFAMGSWISFQEFVGLAYWGRSYDPDWVVTMDGVNDGTLVCGEAKGAGKPMHNDSIEAYIMGYLFGQNRPDFFRGKLEDILLRYSSLYRGITGKSPLNLPKNLKYITESTPESRTNAIRDVAWIEVDRQVRFYLDTERQIANLFPKAKVILSTQPMVNQFRGHFMNIYDYPAGSREREKAIEELEKALRAVYDVMKGGRCGDRLKGENFGYFFASIALGTERLAQTMSKEQGRPIIYENMGRFFEDAFESRKPYFIDPVHMSEQGMDVVAQKYAEMILLQDFGKAVKIVKDQ
jgi:hypothetical protein